MLQQDKIDLTLLEGTLLLKKSGQSSHNGTSLSDLLLGEETEVSEFGDEDPRLSLERFESLELLNDGTIYWSAHTSRCNTINLRLLGLNAKQLRDGLDPSDRSSTLGEVVDLSVGHQTNFLPGSDDFAEASIPHSTSAKVLDTFQTVELPEDSGVSVGVGDEVVRGSEVIRLGCAHEVFAGNFDDLSVLEVLAVVIEGHEDADRGPRELITEGVVGGLYHCK